MSDFKTTCQKQIDLISASSMVNTGDMYWALTSSIDRNVRREDVRECTDKIYSSVLAKTFFANSKTLNHFKALSVGVLAHYDKNFPPAPVIAVSPQPVLNSEEASKPFALTIPELTGLFIGGAALLLLTKHPIGAVIGCVGGAFIGSFWNEED